MSRSLAGRAAAVALCTVVSVASSTAVAAAPEVFDDEAAKAAADTKKSDPGWVGWVDIGAGLALSSVTNVVGKQDGLSLTLSANLAGGVNYLRGIHDWRTSLRIALSFTQSPALPDLFVKSTDNFDFDTAYFMRQVEWVGPFVRFGIATQMLPGKVMQPVATTYHLDGVEVGSGTEFELTDPFQPLTLKQSLGAFFRPSREKVAEVEFRLGVGAREVIAAGQLSLNDDDATADVVELAALTDSQVLGGEIRAQISGVLDGGRVTYAAHAEFLLPFYDSVADQKGLSFADGVNYDFGARLSFKIVEWMSLDYAFKALYQPQVIEKWQVTNTLLLTFGWGFRTSEVDAQKAE